MSYFLGAGAVVAFFLSSKWTVDNDYIEAAKVKCPSQYFSYSLCKKAHGENSPCEDATYDLEVCAFSGKK